MMMGRKHREQASLFYEFRLDDMIPNGHLLRRINVFVTSVLGDLHEQLGPSTPMANSRWRMRPELQTWPSIGIVRWVRKDQIDAFVAEQR
jgi:transposase